MTIPRSAISENALRKRLQSGVGTGAGAKYVPWFTTENVDTKSHSGKYYCPVDERYRHHLSDTEEGLRLAILRDPVVSSARENFPLTIRLTVRICERLGFRHPRSSGAGRPLTPFTTDLLVSRREPPQFVALAGKLRKELRKITDCRSLIVEHVYWSLYGVPFLIATEHQVTANVLISLRFLRPEKHLAERDLLKENTCTAFYEAAVNADWTEPLLDIVRQISLDLRISSEEGMKIFQRLAYSGELECDLELGIGPQTRNVVIPRKK